MKARNLFAAILVALFFVLLLAWPRVSRAQDPGFNPSAGPPPTGLVITPKLWAGLPDPTTVPGRTFYVADAPGGSSLVFSDGTTWRVFARGVSSLTYTLTAADAGVHAFTFANTAVPNVQVTVTDNTTLGMLTWSTTNVSSVGATVRVQRGQALPALAASLLNFNPFVGGTTAGVTINLLVVPTN